MEQTFKIFLVDKQPYLTIDEDVAIGDCAIISVGELYPTFVECKNDEQINLFQKPKTSLTKRHKVVMKPDELNLDQTLLSLLKEKEGPLTVTYQNGEIKVVDTI
jgi:hypothetical protein